jgi:Tfp pilus assembly protein PilV
VSGDRESGFSLVEVLVATGVLVAGIASVVQLFLIATQATVDARDATYAAVLAAQKIEELRAAPFPGPGYATEYLNGRGAQVLDRGDSLYERRWTVAPLPAQPADTVVLTVRVWRRARASRAVRLTTVRTRRGE